MQILKYRESYSNYNQLFNIAINNNKFMKFQYLPVRDATITPTFHCYIRLYTYLYNIVVNFTHRDILKM